MAFPSLGVQSSANRGSNATSTSISALAGTTAGSDVYVFVFTDGAVPADTVTAGWTRVATIIGNATDSCAIFKGQSNLVTWPLVVTHPNENTAWIRQEVLGGGTPQFSTTAEASTGQPDPPSFTPSGGAQDWLWFAIFVTHSSASAASAAPSGFTSLTQSRANATTTGTSGGFAVKQENVATQNPGAFAGLPSDDWGAIVMAIPPASSGSTYTGSGAVSGPKPVLAGTGSHTPPTYSGTSAAQGPKPVLAGTGSHTPPTFTGSGALLGPKPTAAGSGSHTPPANNQGSGALLAPVPGVAGSGSFTRVNTGSGAVSGPKPTLAAAGTYTAPTFTGVGDLEAPEPILAGSGTFYKTTAIIPVPVLTAEDVLYGDRITSYRWEVLEHSNGVDNLIGFLDGVSDASLRWQQNSQVKGTGKVEVVDLDEAAAGFMRISQLTLESVRLRPVQIIQGLPENPLGVFLVSNATEGWEDTGRVWSLELLDRCTVPAQDSVDQSYSVAAGTVVLQEVRAILATSNEWISIDESNTIATKSGMAWDPGTSKLKIINELLDVAGYNALWMDGYGNFRTTPRVLPADRSLVYDLLGVPRELVDGEQAIYQPDWTRDRDSFEVPNKVIAVQAAGGADNPALVGQWTNTDSSSPYSYPSRGRWIPRVLESVEVPEGTDPEIIAFLEARARATLVQLSAVQAVVKITHLPIPVRVSEVLRFAHTKADIDTRHVITAIDLELSSLGLMKSTLQEVISL